MTSLINARRGKWDTGGTDCFTKTTQPSRPWLFLVKAWCATAAANQLVVVTTWQI